MKKPPPGGFFFFGASIVYGVGGAKGGFVDMLKQDLSSIMFTPSGTGDKYEVFNLAKPGATTDFVNTYKSIVFQFSEQRIVSGACGASLSQLAKAYLDCNFFIKILFLI